MNKSALALSLACAMESARAIGAKEVAMREQVQLGGPIEVYHNGQLVELVPNIVPAAMRSYLLKAGYAGGAQISTWYIAPFILAVEPPDGLTAANFEATLDEFTNYTQAARPTWVQQPESGQAIANSVTLAAITVGVGGGTINGIVMSSVATKGAATGTIAAATKFAAPRPMLEGDTLEFKYTMQANLPAA